MKKINLLFSFVMTMVMIAMCPQKLWADDVASVTINGTTTGYEQFSDAFSAAQSGTKDAPATLKLLQNVSVADNTALYFEGGVVTLDLNGKTISGKTCSYPEDKYYPCTVLKIDNGDLTITDTSEEQTGTIKNALGDAIFMFKGSLTIYAGTFHGGNYGACALFVDGAYCNVKLYGGHYIIDEEDGYSAVYIDWALSCLASGYNYYDASGNLLKLNDDDNDDDCGNVMTADLKNYVSDITVMSPTVTMQAGSTTTYYSSLENAITPAQQKSTAATPATIKLLSDATLEAKKILSFSSGVVTLDLNGKNINGNSNSLLNVLDGGNLTVTDASTGDAGTVTNSYKDAINVEGGTLNVQKGTFKGGSDMGRGLYANNCAVTLEGGRFMTTSADENAGALFLRCSSSALAAGLSYYDADDNKLEDEYSGWIHASDGVGYATDVTVKKTITALVSVTINGITNEYNYFTDAVSYAIGHSSSTKPATITLLNNVTYSSSDIIDVDNCTLILDLHGKTITSENNTLMNVSSKGNLTITDTSNGKNGCITAPSSRALACLGGSLTIHAGTISGDFTAMYASGTVLLDGGRFISTRNCALSFPSDATSPLAGGYGFYDPDGNLLTLASDGYVYKNGTEKATDIIVKAIPTGVEGIENGKLEVEDSSVYNLAGQRVSAGAKGLVIKNGKKYFNK